MKYLKIETEKDYAIQTLKEVKYSLFSLLSEFTDESISDIHAEIVENIKKINSVIRRLNFAK